MRSGVGIGFDRDSELVDWFRRAWKGVLDDLVGAGFCQPTIGRFVSNFSVKIREHIVRSGTRFADTAGGTLHVIDSSFANDAGRQTIATTADKHG